jgi:hypothetical protein
MAKVNGNLFMQRLSGTVGDQMIIKTVRGGRTIISMKPTFNGERVFTEAQLAQQQAFREATAYGKMMKGEEIYITKANGSAKTPYNVAVADWFNRPQILEVDLSGWTNGNGGIIRVRAQDDVKVEQVKVMLTDESGALVEEGQVQEVGALWWEYSTSQAAGGNLQVSVSARDLPGHVAEWNELMDHPRMP